MQTRGNEKTKIVEMKREEEKLFTEDKTKRDKNGGTTGSKSHTL